MIPTDNYKKIILYITICTAIIAFCMIISNYGFSKNYKWINIFGVIAINMIYQWLFSEFMALKYWRFQMILALSSIALAVAVSQIYFKISQIII